jgi:hypothetical protein
LVPEAIGESKGVGEPSGGFGQWQRIRSKTSGVSSGWNSTPDRRSRPRKRSARAIWNTNIFNANDGNRNLCVVAHFYLDPDHEAARARQKLHDVALTSPYLDLNHPIRVIVQEQPWGTHYQLKAYPLDSRDQFQFVSDLTVRGKDVLTKMGVKPARALPAPATQDYSGRA